MNHISVITAAKIYGKDPSWVRAGIVYGWLPIGVATCDGQLVTDFSQANGRINYYISPKLFHEHTGYTEGSNEH